jgi:precorrin-6A/cobalt-precorrin-6A reductase
MKTVPHILLLAGSAEARRVAEALEARVSRYVAWLSEAPRGAAPLPQIPVLKRFESGAQMQQAMAQGGFGAVIDAGHVFDRSTTARAQVAAVALGLPYLRIERPCWEIGDWPNALRAPDVAAACALVPEGVRVFATTGWDSLADYAGFRGARLLLRQTRRHARQAQFDFAEPVFGDPPFSAAQEEALFKHLRVDLLICRNLGGKASRAKLDAAAALGCGIILIDRPALARDVPRVPCVDAALAWLEAL